MGKIANFIVPNWAKSTLGQFRESPIHQISKFGLSKLIRLCTVFQFSI